MLGLPAKLALCVIVAIGLFVVGLAGFADHRLTQSRSDQAGELAISEVRSVGSQITESDFTDVDAEYAALLNDRVASLRKEHPDLNRLAVYSAEKGGAITEKVSASQPRDMNVNDDLAARAADALRDGAEARGPLEGSSVVVAWALPNSDGAPRIIIAAEYDASPIAAAASTDRTRLLIGAVLGGALLGVIVLLLLRRELFRPLEEIRRVMSQVRAGARGVRIGWNRSDELGAVADDFDAMLSELEAAQVELAKFVNCDPLTGLLTRDAFTDRFAAELTRARREGYPITLLAIDIDSLDDVNRTHDRAAGDQVLAAVGSVISGCTRPTDACGRTGDDSFHIALVGAEAAQAAVVISRIRREIAERVGIGPERTRVTCGYGIAEFPQHAVDQISLERMAESACAHAQRDGRDQAVAFGPSGGYVDATTLIPDGEQREQVSTGAKELASTVHALARALDGIDPALGGSAHSQRVARYAAAVARDLGMSDSELRELRSAAVLHDVGKVAVPPAILRQPEAALDDRERGALRYHAWVSRTMIAGAGLASVADVVFHLPERWDGAGYPERLREDDIPLASRILRAAELLDDLTSPLAGRTTMTPFAAAAELKRQAGSELDPDVAIKLASLVRDEGLVGNAPAAAASEVAAPVVEADAA